MAVLEEGDTLRIRFDRSPYAWFVKLQTEIHLNGIHKFVPGYSGLPHCESGSVLSSLK